MAILDPGTRSPGKLALFYTHGLANVQHHSSVNYLAGVNLNDVTTIRADANTLMDFMRRCQPASMTMTGWAVLNPDGAVLYREEFGTRPPGTHAISGSMQDFYSPTIAIPGRGAPTGVGSGSGRTTFRIWVGGAYLFVPGDKIMRAANLDGAFTNLVNHLSSNLRYYADFYGQHADPAGTFPVQFNAHTQRRNGT